MKDVPGVWEYVFISGIMVSKIILTESESYSSRLSRMKVNLRADALSCSSNLIANRRVSEMTRMERSIIESSCSSEDNSGYRSRIWYKKPAKIELALLVPRFAPEQKKYRRTWETGPLTTSKTLGFRDRKWQSWDLLAA
jgi:hypothetical protein